MKNIMAISALLFLSQLAYAEDSDEWINKNASIRTTATTEKDSNGNIKSIKIVKDTTIYIKQTITEINKPDKTGDMKTFSRTTVSTDIFGGSSVVIESTLPGTSILVTTSITTTEKTPDGLMTTIYARDKIGNMKIVSQTTSVITNNGGNAAVVTTL